MLSMVSTKRMTRIAVQPRNQPASSPEHGADKQRNRDGKDGHHERGARAIEDTREQIAAEIVGTEQIAGGRGGGAGRTQAHEQRLAQRVVVREQVGTGRGQDEAGEKREDDDDAGESLPLIVRAGCAGR